MPNIFVTIAVALTVAAILLLAGAWRVMKALGVVLQLIAAIFVVTPLLAVRRRLSSDAALKRRLNAARLIA